MARPASLEGSFGSRRESPRPARHPRHALPKSAADSGRRAHRTKSGGDGPDSAPAAFRHPILYGLRAKTSAREAL